MGHININICAEEELLECVITDNGIGRKQAALNKKQSLKKERSLGLEITKERLKLYSEENNMEAGYFIEDLEDENGAATGTKVTIRFARKEVLEEAI